MIRSRPKECSRRVQ